MFCGIMDQKGGNMPELSSYSNISYSFWPFKAPVSTVQYLEIQFHHHKEQYANFTNPKAILLFRRTITQCSEILTFPTFFGPLKAPVSTVQYLEIQFHHHKQQYANFTNPKPILLFRSTIAQCFEIHN